jgi:sodium-coupled neutral amino acid transporter 11
MAPKLLKHSDTVHPGIAEDAAGDVPILKSGSRVLEDIESPSGGYGAVDAVVKKRTTSGRHLNRRQTFAHGEQFYHQSKYSTWTIEKDEGTMDDISIVINILADLAPAGVLPLSFGMTGTGVVPAVALVLVFAAAAAYMMYLVGRTVSISGRKSYSHIWEEVVGSGTVWIPTFVVFTVCFGCCLAYACMFGDLFAGCMPAFGIRFGTRTVCLISLSIFPLLPLCMLKDLSALAPTSFGALLAVLYMIFMMVARYLDGSYAPGGAYFDAAKVGQQSGATWSLDASSLLLVNGLAVAFLCHYNGCKYYREFINTRPDRFGSKILLSFSIVSVLFAASMLLGYYTFGSLSDGVILNNYAADDLIANVARFGMGLANVFSFPLMFSGLREQSLALIVFFVPSMEETCDLVLFQNGLSAFFLGILTLIAVLVTDASLVIGLVGSICGGATIYVLPTFLFDRASRKHLRDESESPSSGVTKQWERNLVRVIGACGVVLMVAGACATLLL